MPAPTDTEDLGRSRIYSFELDGIATRYTASGVIDGVIEDRWSMDEHDGVLRLAVGPTFETGNFSSVLTLREDGADLEEIGRVDKLGVDEDIKSVRWFDDLAIVVTFRQVDPLYAVDLTEPLEPRLLGELKIPGYSEYLHPISGQRLIGLGQDALTTGQLLGAQAALFDVSDLTDPRRTDHVTYRQDSVAAAATDPRQFTWLPGQDTALAVVSEGWEGTDRLGVGAPRRRRPTDQRDGRGRVRRRRRPGPAGPAPRRPGGADDRRGRVVLRGGRRRARRRLAACAATSAR